jgi:hypothetical protein
MQRLKDNKMTKGMIGQQRDRMVRALAGRQDDSTSTIILKGAAGGVEFKAAKEILIGYFQEAECYKFIDPAAEPPHQPGDPADAVLENTFIEPPINVVAVANQRFQALLLAINTAFDIQDAAVPAAGNVAAGGANWTVMHNANRLAELQAQRAVAILDAEMKRDDIQAQQEAKEVNRLSRQKSFKKGRAACGGVFNERIAAELLSSHREDLNAYRYRKVWKNLCARLDGTLGGVNNTMSVVTEITNFFYCSSLSMDDNIQYTDHVCALANYDEEHKRAVLLSAIDKSPRLHKEIREAAAAHKYMNSDYPHLVQALRTTYSTLINNGKISQSPKEQEPITHYASETANLIDTKRKGGGWPPNPDARYPPGGKHKKRGAPNPNGPGGKRIKAGEARYCAHCKVNGHTDAECWQLHPCTKCGSKTHGDWNHDRVVSRANSKEDPTGTPLSLPTEFNRTNH